MHRSRQIIIHIICFILSINSLQSSSENIQFDQIGPIVIPNCILQDSYGFIWIGAQEGLIKYDGYNFKRYTNIPFDSTSLSNNWVMAVEEDKKGNLWIGTWGGGLNYFDQKTEKFTRYILDRNKSNHPSNVNIGSIIVNNDGSLWIGTQDQGLVHFKIDSTRKVTTRIINLSNNSISADKRGENFVLDLFKDRNGKLWIGTIGGGLKMLNPETGKITHFKHNPDNPTSISSNIVSSICEDSHGNLWIGTGHFMFAYGNGLNKFDPGSKQFIHYKHNPGDPNSLASNNVTSLLIDSEGILWIGTLNNYLNSIPISELLNSSSPKFTHYYKFNRSNINSIYEDRLGNIWIALFGRTVHIYNRQQNPFIWYRYMDGKTNTLWSSAAMVQVDKSGNLWFGGGGLDRYNPINGEYTHFSHNPANPSGLNSNVVTSICEDKYGYYWIGTSLGLNRFDPKTGIFKHYQEEPDNPFGLRSNIINEVLTSKAGDLWIASLKSGLQLYDLDKNRFYHLEIDTVHTTDVSIYNIFEDQTGTLWIQTTNYGLYSLNLKDHKIETIKHYINDENNRNSLSYNLVSDVIRPQVVDTNALWIATSNGLNRLDLITDTFKHFYIEHGLPSNHILKVLEDDEGNIWCTCVTGMAVYNVKSGEIKNFSKDDGMPIDEFSGRSQNACKTADGQLIFGAAIGALGFYPDQLKTNTLIPPVHLTDFKIHHESVKLDTAIQFAKSIELTHEQNAFSIEFVALNFINPGKNQYAYKLKGFHDDWIQCRNERIASFTNLDPGSYVFHVKGSNNHGVWNEVGTSVNITIRPPWWRTNWSYLIYIILLGMILYALRQYDLKRQRLKHQLALEHEHTENLQEIDRMKSRFFANISHEFRTPLTLILGPIKKWLPQLRNHGIKQDLQIMQRNANRLFQLINQLLDLSRIEAGGMPLQARDEDIVLLLRGYMQSFESFAKIKHINLKFLPKKNSIKIYLDRDKIEKIIYNLLSNAFKFTPEKGTVEVTVDRCSYNNYLPIAAAREFAEITISNTGFYIPPEKIKHIFDRFYQADDSAIHGYAGSGIGLALTKELIELHHGKIDVVSKIETGTTFTVNLPLGIEHLTQNEIVSSTSSPAATIEMDLLSETELGEKEHFQDKKGLPLIMIVEDNKDVRFYIRGHLDQSFRLIEASNGKVGFRTAIQKIPDLIISDVMMPGMGGFELCCKLKSDERTSHIPVILLTARAEMSDKINGLETGADDYLTKPFDAEELLARIKNLISQREKLRNHYLKTFSLELSNPNLTSVDQLFITKTNSIIEKHISDSEFSISDFAREVGFSHSQLIRKLEGLTGLKPSHYIRSYRLLQAKQMFDQKVGNISQVAYDSGFSNLSYFSRSFKAQFGLLPSQYIKQIS